MKRTLVVKAEDLVVNCVEAIGLTPQEASYLVNHLEAPGLRRLVANARKWDRNARAARRVH
jgi:hypothetical protein